MKTEELQATLGLTPKTSRRRMVRWAVVLAVVVLAAYGVIRAFVPSSTPAPLYQTERVEHGDLTVAVTATGELKPVTQVNIGTEISGVVESVSVDFNSPVRQGQILARVNTEKLDAQAAQARAALLSAGAKRLQADATLAEARASLARLARVRELSDGRVPSQQEFDAQEATVKRAEAELASVAAQVAQSQASLDAIETDIRKAVIRSPITGIVLDRQVDPGQTVAASFQTPTLFTLAEDLTKMRLIVAVDEADIGQVRTGQRAIFRVDAYPDRQFVSSVTEVRSAPTTSNGVVTYQTVLAVENAEGLLQPGMTATADIVVTEVRDAVLLPNAALRFTPPAALSTDQGFFAGPPQRDRSVDAAPPRVWVPDGQAAPRAIDVTVGPSDGRVTVLRSGDVTPGTELIVDLATTR
ncbi:MAG: hypothetical protein ABS36_13765 [Acidobacteria bacterium SCN 69-37]|nr:MAG: hypothetical protein ABS36_13765 [Acidobacteria bacterium SCN 69-37]